MKHARSFRYWLEFVSVLTEKEIKARYKRSYLGLVWMVIQPLLQMLIIGVVFQFFVPFELDHYFLFLFAGLLPWNFFSLSVLKSVSLFVNERYLLRKANFPRETLVLSVVAANFFHFLVALLVLLPVLFFAGTLSWNLWWLLPASLWWFGFTFSLSLLTASLNVQYRDVHFLVQALLPVWFYATPVVYSLSFVPTGLQQWLYLNPLTVPAELFQHAVLGISPTQTLTHVGWGLVVTGVLAATGWLVFRKHSVNFDDWM